MQVAAVGVHDEQVGEAPIVAGEHDLPPVGGPGRRRQAVQRDADAPDLLASLHVEDDEVVAVLVLGGDGEEAPVGRERPGRVDEAQALVVAVERRFDEPPQHASALPVREVEVHEERVALAEVGDLLPVRRQRRRDVQRALRSFLRQERLRDAPRAIVLGELGQEGGLDGVPPLVRQVVERHPQRAPERPLDAACRRGLENLADHLVAPTLAHVRPDGVTEPIGENPRVVGELLDGREMPFQRRVPQPHRGVRIERADRQVLRHALHEPQRGVHVDQRLHPGADAAPAEHVVLELVDHLVADHVLELFIGPGERQHHPVLEELRDAAGALADVAADGVGLLEVRMRRVQQDRLAALELVVEHAREASVPALGNAGRVERGRPLGRVVVDVEVLRLDDAKIEGAVLDLVLPEVLRRGGQRAGERQRHRRCRGPSHPAHGFERPPRAPVASTGASPQSRSSW